jgi:nanoRNase/pAp phosphatase (c-di-AMP/oligoRNAs hydrolase)
VSVGRSIFNRTSRTNLGVLMSMYGGGGQPGAGACVLQPAAADRQIAEIVASLRRNG